MSTEVNKEVLTVNVELPGEVVAPFHINRPPVYDGSQDDELRTWMIDGARQLEGWDRLSDESVEAELGVIARHPEEKATFYTVGMTGSSEGFLPHNLPFTSFADQTTSDNFRVIADTLMVGVPDGHRPAFYDPLLTARSGFSKITQYSDNAPRMWDRDEVYSQLTRALAERGALFSDSDHLDKSHPQLYTAGTVFRMLRMAYDLTRLPMDEIVAKRVERSIVSDFNSIEVNWRRFRSSVEYAGKTANLLAGTEIIKL